VDRAGRLSDRRRADVAARTRRPIAGGRAGKGAWRDRTPPAGGQSRGSPGLLVRGARRPGDGLIAPVGDIRTSRGNVPLPEVTRTPPWIRAAPGGSVLVP